MLEATGSGTLTDIISNASFTGIAGGIVGFVSAILLKFGDGYVKEYFEKRQKERDFKNKMAAKLMDVCIEGSTVAWNAMPGSQRHIQRIAVDIDTIDKELGDKLRIYLSRWVLCALPQTPPYNKVNPTLEDISQAGELQREANKLGEELLEVARNWKKS